MFSHGQFAQAVKQHQPSVTPRVHCWGSSWPCCFARLLPRYHRVLWESTTGRAQGPTLRDDTLRSRRGKVIDLLPDRSTESIAEWLMAHPDIEIVSRDRTSLYAEPVAKAVINCSDRQSHHLIEWLRSGCLIRITAASLTGRFGKRAEATSHQLLKKKLGPLYRQRRAQHRWAPPAMAEAYMLLKARYGRSLQTVSASTTHARRFWPADAASA